MELEIEKFSPTKAELIEIVGESEALELPDTSDQVQLSKVKDARIRLRDTRTSITKLGKSLREDAIKFQKVVLDKEKELLKIIKPEEDRLIGLEEIAKKEIERKARIELLPERKNKLAGIGDDIVVSDEELLGMDNEEFQEYLNKRIADKNETDRKVIADRQAELDKDELQEKARREERERIEREREAEEKRIAAEKEAKEAKIKAEKERIERDARYQKFLKKQGYSEEKKEKFHIVKTDKDIRVYKLTGIFPISPSENHGDCGW